MNIKLRTLRGAFVIALSWAVISCGGGGGGGASAPSQPTPANNVASVIVDAGPAGLTEPSINTAFTSVTLCMPGSTSQCTVIDHVQVDTASFGVRILASALPAGFSLPLQPAIGAASGSLVECIVFGDGYSWGPVALADFTIGGESVSSMPVQIIGDSRFLPASTDCSSQTTGIEEDTVASFGANGIIGIGVIATDCPGCSQSAMPAVYFACTSASACTSTIVPLANQVPNPISRFPTDNNGSFLVFPTVAPGGAATVTGSLIFGVDTQSNNASGSQTVLFVDPNSAELTMVYKGTTLSDSFIDSGTNGIYFADSSLATCTDATTFYCVTQSLPLAIQLRAGGNLMTNFNVVSADSLTNPAFAVFPGLAGTLPPSLDGFDWGLSFFFGKRVATVISGESTSVGTGPYIAF
jgi:Protein of unknown function (DUF3443)